MLTLVDALLDRAGRLSYRRLLVFLAATALLLSGHLDEGYWTAVAVSFVGASGLEAAAKASRF